jgi:hypothetical protein
MGPLAGETLGRAFAAAPRGPATKRMMRRRGRGRRMERGRLGQSQKILAGTATDARGKRMCPGDTAGTGTVRNFVSSTVARPSWP